MKFFLVRKGFEFVSSKGSILLLMFINNSDIRSNSISSFLDVSSDHNNRNSGLFTPFNGGSDFFSGGVSYGHDAEENGVSLVFLVVVYILKQFVRFWVGTLVVVESAAVLFEAEGKGSETFFGVVFYLFFENVFGAFVEVYCEEIKEIIIYYLLNIKY